MFLVGELCGAEINECLSNPCVNGGVCEDLLDQYVCTCKLGYTGTTLPTITRICVFPVICIVWTLGGLVYV